MEKTSCCYKFCSKDSKGFIANPPCGKSGTVSQLNNAESAVVFYIVVSGTQHLAEHLSLQTSSPFPTEI